MVQIQKEAETPSAGYIGQDDDRPSVRVVLYTNSYHVEDSEDSDGGEWSYRGDTETTFDNVEVYAEDGYTPARSKLVAGDTAYVVLAQYSTGDTFSRESGCVEVLGVESNSEMARSLVAEAYKADTWNFIFNGWNYHVYWLGYFESLERLWYEKVVVQ